MERKETTKTVEDLRKAANILESVNIADLENPNFKKEVNSILASSLKIINLYSSIWDNKLRLVNTFIKEKEGDQSIEDFYKLCSKKMEQDIKDLLTKNIKEVKKSNKKYHHENVSIITIETEEGDEYMISSPHNMYTILPKARINLSFKDIKFSIYLESNITNLTYLTEEIKICKEILDDKLK